FAEKTKGQIIDAEETAVFKRPEEGALSRAAQTGQDDEGRCLHVRGGDFPNFKLRVRSSRYSRPSAYKPRSVVRYRSCEKPKSRGRNHQSELQHHRRSSVWPLLHESG